MATDEALLAAGAATSLRTYSWQPTCCSLGYFQDYASVRSQLPANWSGDLVRRITGGGAIIHQQEVTYCLIARRGRELPWRMQQAFALLHQQIAARLRAHGVDCNLNQTQLGDKRYQQDSRCFASPAVSDIMSGGSKMLGSAARQHGEHLLVHGSLKMDTNDWDADTIAGCGLDADSVRELLIAAISRALGLEATAGELSSREEQLIEDYHQARYSDQRWLKERQGVRACGLATSK